MLTPSYRKCDLRFAAKSGRNPPRRNSIRRLHLRNPVFSVTLKQAKASVSANFADLRRQMKERDDKLQEMKKKATVFNNAKKRSQWRSKL